MIPDALLTRCLGLPGPRALIAVAGPPASGKSTFAAALVKALATKRSARLVPMDGLHLDNDVLDMRGLRPRKGAPETFDAAGLLRLVRGLAAREDVVAPSFDRMRDLSVAGAIPVPETVELVVVEGNYLLSDAPVWRDLAPFWSLTIGLDVPDETLRTRLIERWQMAGLDPATAEARASENDIPNAATVRQSSRAPDLMLSAK